MPDDITGTAASNTKTNRKYDIESNSLVKLPDGYVTMKKSWVRWVLLGMACFYMFGNNFCYDNPGPLETQLEA